MFLGVQGLALLRNFHDGEDATAQRLLAEIRLLSDDEELGASEPVREADLLTAYGSWSRRYDEPGNPIIGLEEPEVWGLLDALPPGRALDAACGTGRHAARLVAAGHTVIGVDQSPPMLDLARQRAPDAEFREARLSEIPANDASFDLVVCGLALAHVSDLDGTIAELSRVLRSGGRLIVSVLHPFLVFTGWQASYHDETGRHFIREHPHTHADYLSAFAAAGLVVRGCIEPPLSEKQIRVNRRAQAFPDAALIAYEGIPGVLIWDAEKG